MSRNGLAEGSGGVLGLTLAFRPLTSRSTSPAAAATTRERAEAEVPAILPRTGAESCARMAILPFSVARGGRQAGLGRFLCVEARDGAAG